MTAPPGSSSPRAPRPGGRSERSRVDGWLMVAVPAATILVSLAVVDRFERRVNRREAAEASLEDEASTPTPSASCPFAPADEQPLPLLAAQVFEGCSDADREALGRGIVRAVTSAAAACGSGGGARCAALYERGAIELEGRLMASCPGPARVLLEARADAGRLTSPKAKLAAIQRTFDALLLAVTSDDSTRL